MASQKDGENDDANVRFIVRTSSQQIDDQTVECKLDWTVARLKDHLAQVYPTKPPRQQQRIIFLGKLLDDSLILRDTIQSELCNGDRLFVVHLVCVDNLSLSSPNTTNLDVDGDDRTTRYSTAASRPEQSVALQRYYSQLSEHQIAWMQQAYAQYLTRMAAQGIQVEGDQTYPRSNDAYINGTAFSEASNNIEENEVPRGPEEDAARGALGAHRQIGEDANNVANNQNGAVNEAGPLNHDWLDIFEAVSRMIVLSTFVVLYSSSLRFFIVTSLGFAIYLIQGGFFRGQPVFLGDNNNADVGDNNNQLDYLLKDIHFILERMVALDTVIESHRKQSMVQTSTSARWFISSGVVLSPHEARKARIEQLTEKNPFYKKPKNHYVALESLISL